MSTSASRQPRGLSPSAGPTRPSPPTAVSAKRTRRDLYMPDPRGTHVQRTGRIPVQAPERRPGGQSASTPGSPRVGPAVGVALGLQREFLEVPGSVPGGVPGRGRTLPAMTTTKHVHPAYRPNPTIRTHPGAAADDARRTAVLEAWARQWGTANELVLLASSHGEAKNLNLLARSTLQNTGRLRGPSVQAGDLELTPGDRIVVGPGGIGRPDVRRVPEGCVGDVRLVDPARGDAVIDFPTAGAVRLTGTCLQRASLRYGYAIPAAPGFGRRFGSVRVAHPTQIGLEIA